MTHEFCVAPQKTQASSLWKTLAVHSAAQILCSETLVWGERFFYPKAYMRGGNGSFSVGTLELYTNSGRRNCDWYCNSGFDLLCTGHAVQPIVFHYFLFFFRTQSLPFKHLLLMVRPPTTLLHKPASRSLPKSLLRRYLLSTMRTGSCCNRLPFQRSLGNTAWQWMAVDVYLCK